MATATKFVPAAPKAKKTANLRLVPGSINLHAIDREIVKVIDALSAVAPTVDGEDRKHVDAVLGKLTTLRRESNLICTKTHAVWPDVRRK